MEIEILSTATINKEALELVVEYGDVYQLSQSKILYRAFNNLYMEGKRIIELPILAEYLRSTGLLERLGGNKFLSSFVQTNTLYLDNVKYGLEELRKRQLKQKIIENSQDLINSIKNNSIDYDKFIEGIIKNYDDINREQLRKSCNISDLAGQDLKNIFTKDNYILTQFLGKFFSNQLITIAAKTGQGKTSLALQLACDINDCLFFSLEMKKSELYARILSRESRINSEIIESCGWNENQLEKLLVAKEKIKRNLNLRVYDDVSDFYTIIRLARKECELKKIKVIFIDYLQKIRNVKGENENIRLGEITGLLKTLAHDELNVPIVLLSQLSRDKMSPDRKPELSDLRGSGMIENDSDQVIFIHNDKEKGTIFLKLKNRKGRTGETMDIKFIKDFTCFECLSQGEEKFDDIKPLYGGIYD